MSDQDETQREIQDRREVAGRRDQERRDNERRDDERRSRERRGTGDPTHWNGIDLRDNDRRAAERREVSERRELERRHEDERRSQKIITDGWPMPGDDQGDNNGGDDQV